MADPTLTKLWVAAQVCDTCGRTWGSAPAFPEAVTSWYGTCHMCGLELGVSHVKHYGYLRRGLAMLWRQLQSDTEGRSHG